MKDRVSIELKDGVADVRLIRADKMNALDPAMFDGILEAASHDTPPLTRTKAATLREHADELRRTQRVVTLRSGRVPVPKVKRNDEAIAALGERYGIQSVLGRW